MSFSDLIQTLVDANKIAFEVQHAPEPVSLREDWLAQTVPLDHLALISILQDEQGMVMALYPATQQLNLATLKSILLRELRFVDTDSVLNRFKALLRHQATKSGQVCGLHIIVDEALSNQDVVYFESTVPCSVLKLRTEQLSALTDHVLLGSRFSEPRNGHTVNPMKDQPVTNLKQRIAKLDRLPAMPTMPARILAIRNNPNSTVDNLVEVLESDPPLVAQILRYANSPLYHHHGKVDSLKDAIFRILGYETVLHLSLGYALGKVFKLPEKGPLGNATFWQHASYTAALTQHLAQAMPRSRRPKPGLAYLAGLLHDIGFLVLNVFFKNEYEWLNKVLISNPNSTPHSVEQRLLGVTHNELGAWLMRAWNIPSEICTAVSEHHNPNYHREHADYIYLIDLAERLLKMHGMSDAESDDIPQSLLDKIGLDEEEVYLIMDKVLQGGPTLREMAKAICS